MKKIILILIIGMFLILPVISALDRGLPMICGGDSELLIGCLGDDELIFLSEEVPPEVWIGISGGGISGIEEIEEVEEPEIEIPPEEPVVKFFKDFFGEKYLLWIISILVSGTIIFFIFFGRRKKKKQTKKLEKGEDLPIHF